MVGHEAHGRCGRGRQVAAALLLAFLAGCAGSNEGAPAHPAPSWDYRDPGLPARLDDALARWASDHELIGVAARVLTPGWLDWSGSTGVQSTSSGVPFELDTVGRIASATKPFTATVIFQLRDEGRLSLDTKLGELVPDYPNGDQITLEHLLRHRSGIPELELADGFFILDVILNDDHWFTPKEILDWTHLPIPMLDFLTGMLVPREPLTYPGGDYHYAQPNYIALGLVIEAITGQPLADVYRERIWEPLGLDQTRLPEPGEPLDPSGYTNVFGLLPVRIPGTALVQSGNSLNSSAWSAGGLISSARDLGTFLSALLDGRLYSAESLGDAMDFLATDPNVPLGVEDYGMGLVREQVGDLTYIGHDGALPGAVSVMKYVPELDVVVSAVVNSDALHGELPDLKQRVAWALRNEPQQ